MISFDPLHNIHGFSDQRLKTAFLVLASTGIRIGALQSIPIADLERMTNLYKIAVYRGEREEYFTFCTPECAKEIDDTIFKAIYGINGLQKELAIMEALRK